MLTEYFFLGKVHFQRWIWNQKTFNLNLLKTPHVEYGTHWKLAPCVEFCWKAVIFQRQDPFSTAWRFRIQRWKCNLAPFSTWVNFQRYTGNNFITSTYFSFYRDFHQYVLIFNWPHNNSSKTNEPIHKIVCRSKRPPEFFLLRFKQKHISLMWYSISILVYVDCSTSRRAILCKGETPQKSLEFTEHALNIAFGNITCMYIHAMELIPFPVQIIMRGKIMIDIFTKHIYF